MHVNVCVLLPDKAVSGLQCISCLKSEHGLKAVRLYFLFLLLALFDQRLGIEKQSLLELPISACLLCTLYGQIKSIVVINNLRRFLSLHGIWDKCAPQGVFVRSANKNGADRACMKKLA